MSKKNNKGTRRRAHAHDLQLEKAALEQRAIEQAKKAVRVAAAGGVKKVKANKGTRIRKGVHIKGIKVTDSDSKKKVKLLLKKEKAEAAARKMDVDVGQKRKRPASSTSVAKSKIRAKLREERDKAGGAAGDSVRQRGVGVGKGGAIGKHKRRALNRPEDMVE